MEAVLIQADEGRLAGRGTGSARPQTAPEQIADRILAAVAVGVLQPGERLPGERELAGMLAVSRTTVRQALARLAALGITESRRGRGGGTFVNLLHPSSAATQAALRVLEPVRREFEALLDYRALIEQLIASTAARRHGPGDDEAMRAALAAYRAARTASGSREADRALHDAVARAAGNPHLAQLARDLVARVNLGFSAEPYSEELRRTALRQHSELVEAIIAGEPERAAALAGRHFQLTTGQAWRVALHDARAGDSLPAEPHPAGSGAV